MNLFPSFYFATDINIAHVSFILIYIAMAPGLIYYGAVFSIYILAWTLEWFVMVIYHCAYV